ncbi:heparin lyase I family protein [Paraglaciecola sp. L3A3]|uniref:heparin lyase I family protein n=1 Tax=Paraglaciecola sp. L3A3 TaxID=2686358 RepID=UPI00131ADC41|nr:heparin lyase I family protein [Paraglaciecola sp. L3A3]
MLKSTILLLLFCNSAFACPIWQAKVVENSPQGWDYLLNPKNIQVVANPSNFKQQVLKLSISPDTSWPNGHSRVEVKHNGCATDEGDSTYISWGFYLNRPVQTINDIAYWETDKSHLQSMGMYLAPVNGSEKIANKLLFFTSLPKRKIQWQQNISIKKWHKIALAIDWSASKSKGQISVWFNNQLVVKQLTVKTKPDDNKLFIQLGLHREQTEAFIDSIYLRNVREDDNIQNL